MQLHNIKIIAKQIKAGNLLAFKTLFDFFYMKLVSYINSIIVDFEMSRDLAQDVFTKLWDNRLEINLSLDFEKYLFKIARNVSLDYLRKAHQNEKYIDYIKKSNFTTYSEERVEIKELEILIKETVKLMPDKAQSIYHLRIEKGKKISEIAKQLNISKQSINWHIANIKSELKKSLKNYYSY
jgi:RNA polymerase sigma-70 factor (ECF subfamily)